MKKGSKYLDFKGRISIFDGKELKCEQDRQRSQCKECGDSGICEHIRRKSQCKEYDGSGICEPAGRGPSARSVGSSICKHGRERSMCKEFEARKGPKDIGVAVLQILFSAEMQQIPLLKTLMS